MAIVRLSQEVDMFSAYVWSGNVIKNTSSEITLSNGFASGTYYGTFYYNAYGLSGGTVTGYTQSFGNILDYAIEGTNLNALTVQNYLDSNNPLGLQQYALTGSDTIYGSSGNDKIQAWSGNDYVYGQNGDDIIKGGTGNDTIDGGSGSDTAYYDGSRSSYAVSRIVNGYTITSNADGNDTLVLIENLRFSDQQGEISTFLQAPTIDNYDPAGIYRFYNRSTGAHFYTNSKAEAENVMATLLNFIFEGLAFKENTSSTTDAIDIFRFYNTTTNTHFYTGSSAEAENVRAHLSNFNYEGVAYQAHSSESTNTTELYRFYNTNTGTHFYTASHTEMENVKVNLAGVMNYEGVAYYVDM